ncbi:MAG: exosome complex exonuclease Rrp41 [Methanosphaera sp.]|uniref:exosome complex exonuclease Rrp41 n=1 Tax=Methanosphaera sp. TaxID=2666342 RepID=UPI0025CDE0B3|nr:exosome complex exonuclease Rrp41 [Methanosphaera sp.]MCI5867357.1 exosome complex exonuclease Rrp41 [Methanosphaera sp.]MDD6534575.1 exosome complex exonuclease Rrp41 [Methanosphaera sp.]MDY3955756.1 exosome complex exonuclease Rrp41 [Methanosphaera sp.]
MNNQFIREDGRSATSFRNMKMEVGILNNADGSAYIECGGNKILVGVYGPRELHSKKHSKPDGAVLRCKYNMAPFSVTERKRPGNDRRSTEISKLISEAITPCVFLEKYPRASIDISIEVLEAEGGTRCLGIIGASLALADAEIPMRDLISACAVGKVDGHIVLDLSEKEDQTGDADVPVAIMPRTGEITFLQMDGNLTQEEFMEALDLAYAGCEFINNLQREALLKKFRGE